MAPKRTHAVGRIVDLADGNAKLETPDGQIVSFRAYGTERAKLIHFGVDKMAAVELVRDVALRIVYLDG